MECLQYLMKKSADPNICDKGGRSPLYWTSFHAHAQCARLLKDCGAKDLVGSLLCYFSLNFVILLQESERGQTALAVATIKGHTEIVKIF